MKKFNWKIFAFCLLGVLLISLAPRSAFANTGEADAGGEMNEEKIESGAMGNLANELAFFLGSKIADVLDEIAGSIESRTERKKARKEQKKREKLAEMPPEDREREERLSGKIGSLASGFAKIFSLIMGEAANSVRQYIEENILPKLKPKDLLVEFPCHFRSVVV